MEPRPGAARVGHPGPVAAAGAGSRLARDVAALEALAQQHAIRISAKTAVGNRMILEAYPVRLQEIIT